MSHLHAFTLNPYTSGPACGEPRPVLLCPLGLHTCPPCDRIHDVCVLWDALNGRHTTNEQAQVYSLFPSLLWS